MVFMEAALFMEPQVAVAYNGKETSAEVEEEEHRFLEGICLPC